MAGLSLRLTSLVEAAPELVPYTVVSLGKGLLPNSPGGDRGFSDRVDSLRKQIAQRYGPWMALWATEQGRQNQIEAVENLLAVKLYQQSSLQLFLKRLTINKPDDLQKLVKDKNPLVRWLVASAIGKRHLHLESDLIALLDDSHRTVRKAGHQALVRSARGTNFGPFPGSSRRGIDRSIEKWRQWLELQQSASSEKQAKDTAIATGKQVKPATLEMVQLVLVPDDKPVLTSCVTKASDELVNAKGDEQISILARLHDAKDSRSTEALVLAIPKLTGDIQQQARDALTERLKRLPSATLRDKLQDDNHEVRSAAALACGRKIAKERIADLLQLLDDPEMAVVQSARVALTELSGEDFGPTRDADRHGHAEAVAAWRKWWKERQSNKP